MARHIIKEANVFKAQDSNFSEDQKYLHKAFGSKAKNGQAQTRLATREKAQISERTVLKKSEDQKHLHKAFGSKTKMARHKQQTHKESSDSDRHALVEHLTK